MKVNVEEENRRSRPLGGSSMGGVNKVRQWLDANGRRFTDKPFIESINQHRTLNYGDMVLLANQTSHYLTGLGIGANDRVVLLANNSLEHLIVYLAVLAHGAVICTVNVESNISYMDELMRALKPRLIIDERELDLDLPQMEGCVRLALGQWHDEQSTGLFAELAGFPAAGTKAQAVSEDADACIYFTSGTSDRPKGVILSQKELFGNVEPVVDAFAITEKDRVLDFRSFNWASAQILGALAPLSCGATLVLASKFSQSNYFYWIRDYSVTIAAGNPTIINMMLNRPSPLRGQDMPALRFVTSSSAPLLTNEWKRFESVYEIKIAQGYGSSETGWIAGSNERTRRIGSAGKPLTYHALTIVDAEGSVLESGETGYVELGGDSAQQFRYLAFDGSICSHATGRIRTGDLGYLDEAGYLYLSGREKELIIRGGVNISPIEIDGVLLGHDAVAEVATIGVPDPIWGEEVLSFVVLKPGAGATPQALLDYAGALLPVHKTPKGVILTDSLTKTARGKLDRKAIAAAWGEADPGAI